MFIYYKESTGEVRMHSEEPIVSNALVEVQWEPSKSDLDKIRQNYCMFFRGGEVVFRKPLHVKKKEQSLAVEEKARLELFARMSKDDELSRLLEKERKGALTTGDLLAFIQKHIA